MFLKDLADQLTSGQIGIPEWQMQMKEFIRVTHREAAIVAYGGVENMTQAAWGFEGSLVKKQYQYLDQFAADIAANPSAWMNGRLFVRMDLYRKAEWGTFEEMLRFQKRQEGWTEERRELGQADHCDGCVQQASLQWRPLGTLETIGSQQCSTNCHCVFHYRRPNGNGGWVYDNGTPSAPTGIGKNQAETEAKKKYAQAVKNEPKITSDIKSMVSETNGRMVGLDHNLKKEESLLEKIQADIKDKKKTAAEAANLINDAVRYTIVYKPENLVSSAQTVKLNLTERGYKTLLEKNFFGSGGMYEGYHVIFRDEITSQTFELQFHTPESFRIKTENHKMYELWRVSDNEQEKSGLWRKMSENWIGFARPDNYESLNQ